MKTLILMRHAKAEMGGPFQDDFDRNLSERGKHDAPEMGKRVHLRGVKPDLIICSAAKRTTKTAKLIADELSYDTGNISRERDLYEATIDDILHVIRQISDEHQCVILVGHNPGITSMVGYLSHTGIEHIPTSGQACIKFDFKTWKQVSRQSGKLQWFDYPKSLSD